VHIEKYDIRVNVLTNRRNKAVKNKNIWLVAHISVFPFFGFGYKVPTHDCICIYMGADLPITTVLIAKIEMV